MEKIKVMVIAPYEGLRQLVMSIAPLYENYNICIETGDLLDGARRAQQAEQEGYDIILSRGGTAEMIEKVVSIPVLNIGVSGYDILRIIKLTQNYTGKAAIIGFESITRGCHAICDLLQTDIGIYTIEGEEKADDILKRLKQDGFNTVVGDAITVKIAEKMGLNSLPFTSGEESVKAALDEVNKYMGYIQETRQRMKLLDKVINTSPYLTMVFDSEKKELFNNVKNEKGIDEIVKKLHEFVDITLVKGEFVALLETTSGNIFQINGKALTGFSTNPVAAFYCQRLKVTSRERMGIFISNIEDLDKVSYNMLSTENSCLKDTLERVRTLSRAGATFLIEGESGVGKDTLASLICRMDGTASIPLVTVDCMRINQEGFEEILLDTHPLVSGMEDYELYFKHIDHLNQQQQFAMLKAIQKIKKHHIIVSSEKNIAELVKRGEFMKELYCAFPFVNIWLPPLRQRREDIKNLSIIIIGKVNEQLGKQIVGLDKQALSLVEEYHWNGNLDQLEQVLHSAARICYNSYITKNEILPLLSEKSPIQHSIDISSGKSLDEMEKEIIYEVLKKEDMNQVRTASRLGISRTTLWRKLQ